MIRKYHNHKLQTTPWHREDEPLNHHKTPGRQIKLSDTNREASDPVPVLSAVPQGSVLGPVLFLIFINDLPDNIRSSVHLFADDCVLYRNKHSLQDCLTLQEDLTSFGQWEADWQMNFNVAKCHSVRVTRHQHHNKFFSTTHYTIKLWKMFSRQNTLVSPLQTT